MVSLVAGEQKLVDEERQLICIVHYLLKSHGSQHRPRPGTGAAVVVVYCLLFLLLSISYFRLLYVVTVNPGYVPRGSQYYEDKSRKSKKAPGEKRGGWPRRPGEKESTSNPKADRSKGISTAADALRTTPSYSRSLHDFMGREIYSCEGDGKPVWCSTCHVYKPDRAHHCREVARCVYKMDHYCPWVGGVISVTSFKFFAQFVFFAAIYSLFNMVHMAVWVSEVKRDAGQINVHWIVTLALGALFGLFTGGMTLSSAQFMFLNITTIENLSRHTKVWQFAVHIIRPQDLPANPPFNTVTFSIPSELQRSDRMEESKMYGILHSGRGENPYDLGYYGNWKSVMGEDWWEWLFPITYSPCARDNGVEGLYEMGDVGRRMKADAGLLISNRDSDGEKMHRRKKRRRRPSRAAPPLQEKIEGVSADT